MHYQKERFVAHYSTVVLVPVAVKVVIKMNADELRLEN